MKVLIAALTIVPLAFAAQNAGAAPASQPNSQMMNEDDSGARDTAALLRGNSITSTGATVPRPGSIQESSPSTLNHDIYRQDNHITNSICKGC